MATPTKPILTENRVNLPVSATTTTTTTTKDDVEEKADGTAEPFQDRNVVVRAFAAVGENDDFVQEWNYHPRTLQPNDVEIRILVCGVCHSDVHLIKRLFGSFRRACQRCSGR